MNSVYDSQIQMLENAKINYLAAVAEYLNYDSEVWDTETDRLFMEKSNAADTLINVYFEAIALAPGAKNNKDVAWLKKKVAKNAATRNKLVEQIVKM